MTSRLPSDPWRLRFTGFDRDDEGRREALCTLGNGYFATRGATPESEADAVHYPGTYIAGCFNRLTSDAAGRAIEHESVVNAPNWLLTTFRIDDGPWFRLDEVEVLDHEQELDLLRGVLIRSVRFRDRAGRSSKLVQRQFVHMGAPHLAGLETVLLAEDWSGHVTMRTGIDGDVRNTGVPRYSELDGQHLVEHSTSESGDALVLQASTSRSGIRIVVAARCTAWRNEAPAGRSRSPVTGPKSIAHDISEQLGPKDILRTEKIAAVYTSRDHAISDPRAEAADHVRDAVGFDDLLNEHALAMHRSWQRYRCGLDTDAASQQAVHLHTFHTMQTISRHSADLDVGVPARGLHGEAYRGHIFWDELFVLPAITLRDPQLTRSCLWYRYRRLPRARSEAGESGHRGAMFPWQSGSNGREESQTWHLNPNSKRWLPDHTHLQRHIGIAIARNIWHYHRATGDDEFLHRAGAEMMLDITRFLASLATYERSEERYVIRGVVGPDEYHTAYPDRDRPGIDNNAYTNIMVAWLCRAATHLLDELPAHRREELTDALDLGPQEVDRWNHLSQRLYVPFHGDGIISQFEGYEHLEELDFAAYRRHYGNIQRLDRILEAEGDDPNRYQVSKQADVLMLFYLLSAEELEELLTGLGYPMSAGTIPANIEYYLQRTCHGSTLSSVVHAWVLARAHRARAVEFFEDVLASDLNDTQGGTTREGIHLAAMAGSLDVLQRCFAGIEVHDEALWLNPRWPAELGQLELPIQYRGQALIVTITAHAATVQSSSGHHGAPIRCVCRGRHTDLAPGETARFPLGG